MRYCRRAYEKNMEQQIGDANKRLSTAASTLNSNIDALWEKLQEQSEKVCTNTLMDDGFMQLM